MLTGRFPIQTLITNDAFIRDLLPQPPTSLGGRHPTRRKRAGCKGMTAVCSRW